MMKLGANRMNRLLAGLLALLMLLACVPAAAQATQEGWQDITVTVLWMDAEGNVLEYPAIAIPEETGVFHGWWATLPEAALGGVVDVLVEHPDPGYTYQLLGTEGLSLIWYPEMNAYDLADDYAQNLTYRYYGVESMFTDNLIKLYLSTMENPFAVAGEEGVGGVGSLPGVDDAFEGGEFYMPGEEGFGSTPGGADLITPAPVEPDPITPPPVYTPATGWITVYYQHVDGQLLDTKQVMLTEGQNTLWPESQQVGGLNLVGNYSATVWLYADGSMDQDNVTFLYETPYVPPVEAYVDVLYVHENGSVLAQDRVTLTEGRSPVYANSDLAQGYELVGSDTVYVTVTADGWADTNTVTFQYRDVYVAPLEAQITLRYVDSKGNDIAAPHVVTKGEGSHTLTPDWTRVPAGYTVFAETESVQVTVRNGVASQSEVKFYFSQAVAAPSVFDVTVHYYDTLGNEIARPETKQLGVGQHWIYPNPQNLPGGYELTGDSAFLLTVYQDGSLDRNAADVGFWYRAVPKEPVKTTITIRYKNEFGHDIAGPYTKELTGPDSHTIAPDASVIPAAYDVSGVQPVTVTVSDWGNASQNTVTFVAELRRETQPIPVGQSIRRYALVNVSTVRFRTEPYADSNDTIIRVLPEDTAVYMVVSEYNTKGEEWTQVIVGGRTGYIQTKFLDMLTQAASDTLAQETGATPVPTFTPAPTPTESIVEVITPAPVTPTPYAGYAIVKLSTPLYDGANYGAEIQDWLEAQEPLEVIGQVPGNTGVAWSYVKTLDNWYGYVPSDNLQQITQAEAEWRISQWQQQNATPTPTVYVTNTPVPQQQQGYARVIRSSAPFRSSASEQSRIIDYLDYGEVVFITGQTYMDGYTWHNVAYDGRSGYIRSDLIRLMTIAEEEAYLKQLTASTPTPTPTPTQQPAPGSELSAFGYVTTNSVNFRTEASKSSSSIMMLHKYAMATVLSTKRVDGVTWYNVRYNGQTGYIHGDFFKQMTVNEYSEFRSSGKYQQGLANNSTQTEPDDEGYTGSGGQVSEEDYIVDGWYANGGLQTLMPTATPTATPTPTLPPVWTNGGGNQVGSSQTDTNPNNSAGDQGSSSQEIMPPAATDAAPAAPQKKQGGSDTLMWIAVILILGSVGTGVGLWMHHQHKRRQIAMKAAQRRAQQARSANRPYARQANQQRMGAYPSYGQNQGPLFPQQEQPNGYEAQPYRQETRNPAPTAERPYARPGEGTDEAPTQRVGRRTAYQQSVQEKQDQ